MQGGTAALSDAREELGSCLCCSATVTVEAEALEQGSGPGPCLTASASAASVADHSKRGRPWVRRLVSSQSCCPKHAGLVTDRLKLAQRHGVHGWYKLY